MAGSLTAGAARKDPPLAPQGQRGPVNALISDQKLLFWEKRNFCYLVPCHTALASDTSSKPGPAALPASPAGWSGPEGSRDGRPGPRGQTAWALRTDGLAGVGARAASQKGGRKAQSELRFLSSFSHLRRSTARWPGGEPGTFWGGVWEPLGSPGPPRGRRGGGFRTA